ncbi:transient receptor potential cation channel subfamily A member 1-like [Stylophora pistillata]|nr:transient receptor potential cation channel subfamily A member 1-like [Stylophora pistillata]XP_022786609.1 transient receptor potential cation channel subfamily A member 1-like [Stylophora pistillata]XP_022786610.1 transient receptor potential cation channel subfamily A member 1-like [Stylophora pistillata]XP_022786611.1 transient receptor potential cation channel subfamily A member 1-like [Stylophora pistillata]XP_022786612.1 transient receptor potential cation channel subfamily A member 1
MDAQINDNGEIPLVNVNDGSGDAEENHEKKAARDRKESRFISTVSMNSGSEDDGEYGKEKVLGGKSTRLHKLILEGEVEEVEKLVAKGGAINNGDKSGKTPLHTAILSKQFKIVDRLLECGADVTIKDDAGDTALHTAIHVGSERLALTLLKRGRADANAPGRNSCTPLHLAAEMDNEKICQIMIDNSGDTKSLDDDRMTPLAHAMERGAGKSAEFLLNHARQLGTVEDFLYDVDVDGNSLLHLAVNSGVLAVVQHCTEYGVRIRQPRKLNRETAFHLACEMGSMPIVEYLVSKDPALCRITLVDFRGRTPLHMAAKRNHAHVVNFLLEKGAMVDPKSDERRTPLFMAAENGAYDVVTLLMERGADVTIRDTELRSVLHAAVGHPRVMEDLLQSPAMMSLITEKDASGYSAVHYAAMKGNIATLELFVTKNKAAASVTSDSLETPIHVAARYGRTEAIEKLMDRQNARILNLQNSQGKTALHFACTEGHDRSAEVLLRLGATIEKDRQDRSPLHLAASKGCAKCCESILQKFEDCINMVDKNKNTALHLAAINGHASVVSLLLSADRKAEVTRNNTNDNILDAAVKEKKSDVVMVIAGNDRWREVLTTCSTGVVPLLQKLVEDMPDALVRILDQLVTESGDQNSMNYKVSYDLALIQGVFAEPEKNSRRTTDTGETGKKDSSKDKAKDKTKETKRSEINSLALIETMAIHRRERCLTHPVSFHLLNTKWKKFGWVTFGINLLTYFLFIIPLTTLAVYTRTHEDDLCGFNSSNPDENKDEFPCTFSNVVVQVFNYFVLITASGHLIKELISMFHTRLSYLEDVSNFLEWVCYIASILYVIPPCDCKAGFKREVGAVALFFGWMNLILYFRRLSSYGQYVIMLSTMFVTLLKVLLLWMLFIMAFGTTFLLIMNDSPFDTFGTSMMTMFVMTLGEMNYHENFLPWDNLAFSTLTNILFIVLVLGMPIIMMNMLVGLAVGDIDKIQQNALMDRYVLQVRLLVDIENSLPEFIMKRVQVYSYSEFPNHPKTIKQKLIDGLIGFDKPQVSIEEEADEMSPEMVKVLERIQKQEEKMQKMYEMMKEQSDVLKEIQSRKKDEKQKKKDETKTSSKLGLFGFS